MNPDLEALLRAWDAHKLASNGADATRLYQRYVAMLDECADKHRVSRDSLHQVILRVYPRWLRANLPPGFPKKLGGL